jgi:hypothetical protein
MASPATTPHDAAPPGSHVNNAHVVDTAGSSRGDFYDDSTHAAAVLRTLRVQKELGTLCDVHLVAGDLTLPAHKCVLAANSSHFNTLFTAPDAPNTVIIQVHNPTAFNDVINYMYSGKLPLGIKEINDYFLIDEKLSIPNLRQNCLQYLNTVLTYNNWKEVLDLALSHELHQLSENVTNLVCSNFSSLYQSPDLRNLRLELFAQIITKANPRQVWTIEYEILESILLQWSERSEEEMEQLLGKVNCKILSTDNVKSLLEEKDISIDKRLEIFLNKVTSEGLSKQATPKDGRAMKVQGQPPKKFEPKVNQDSELPAKNPVQMETAQPVKRKRGRPRKIVQPPPPEVPPEQPQEDIDIGLLTFFTLIFLKFTFQKHVRCLCVACS